MVYGTYRMFEYCSTRTVRVEEYLDLPSTRDNSP